MPITHHRPENHRVRRRREYHGARPPSNRTVQSVRRDEVRGIQRYEELQRRHHEAGVIPPCLDRLRDVRCAVDDAEYHDDEAEPQVYEAERAEYQERDPHQQYVDPEYLAVGEGFLAVPQHPLVHIFFEAAGDVVLLRLVQQIQRYVDERPEHGVAQPKEYEQHRGNRSRHPRAGLRPVLVSFQPFQHCRTSESLSI